MLLVRRAIVTGVVSDVKTKYSNAGMPLDPALAEVLRKWWDDASRIPRIGVREPVPGGQKTLGALERRATPYHSRSHSLWYRTHRPGTASGTPSGTPSGHSWMKPELLGKCSRTLAPRRHSHHDERLRKSYGRKQTQSAREGCAHGVGSKSGLVPLSAPWKL